MGMFDSFYVKGQEVQTKALDNCLNVYNLGDTVPNYDGNFDGPTGTYYLIEDIWPSKEWIGLIMIDNIFVDAVKSMSEEETRRITKSTFATLKDRPEFVAQLLTNIVKTELNPKLKDAERKLRHIRSVMYDYKLSKEPEDTAAKGSRLLESLHPKVKQFRQGAELGQFISDILDNKVTINEDDADHDIASSFYETGGDE